MSGRMFGLYPNRLAMSRTRLGLSANFSTESMVGWP